MNHRTHLKAESSTMQEENNITENEKKHRKMNYKLFRAARNMLSKILKN